MVDMSARDRDPIAALDPLDTRPGFNHGPVRFTSGSRDLPITGAVDDDHLEARFAALASGLDAIVGSMPTEATTVWAPVAVEPVRASEFEPRRPASRPSMLEIFEETQARFPVIMACLAE